MTPKAQATKTKIGGTNQSKKLLYSKRNNNEKAAYEMGQNTCKPYI